jgi:hypothetical protein
VTVTKSTREPNVNQVALVEGSAIVRRSQTIYIPDIFSNANFDVSCNFDAIMDINILTFRSSQNYCFYVSEESFSGLNNYEINKKY